MKILNSKMSHNFEKICGENLKEINEIYEKATSLGYYDRPDYEQYIKILRKRFKEEKNEKNFD